MRLFTILIAAAAAALVLAATSQAHIPRPGCTTRLAPAAELACARANLKHGRDVVAWAKAQQRAPTFMEAGSVRALKLGHLIRSHEWLMRAMRGRVAEARARMQRTFPLVGDWLTAVRVVQRAYPGSGPWLTSCSAGEGGHGVWVPQAQGGTPGGWLQYMPGTFEHDFNRALADVRARGFVVPAGAHSWKSALGQALAGGWAWGHDRPAGKWTGGGC